MSKTIKITDLFFKIVNDKEIPEKIKHKGLIYEYQKEARDYAYIDKNSYYTWFINETVSDITCLNDEVEIIEEQQDIDIQEIEELYEWVTRRNGEVTQTEGKILEIGNKLNKLIQAIKQLDRNINKE